ncbi:MAG: hypothetical protein H0T79_23655, partial [Deltaproteobacteria bacterium]|nr:hypothetical protein [Deltaproteobacteria bacterium]
MKRRPHSFGVRLSALATLLPFVMTSCGGTSGPSLSLGSGAPLSDLVLVQHKDLPDGLDLRVSDGKQGVPAYDRATLAPAKRLAEAEAAQLLSRAAALKAD